MPDFAVATHFTVKEQLTSFFVNGERNANKFQSAVSTAFKKTGHEANLFKEILGGVTLGNLAASGVQKLGSFIGGIPESLAAMAEKGEALAKTATIIGTTTDELQNFNYAAKMSDISTEGMQSAIQKMNKGLGELKVHEGTIESGLKKINPQLMYQLRTAKDSQSAFLMVSDAMSKTSSAQTRAAIATAVFGKAGQDMIPMLMKGKDGITALMAETDKYSGKMSKEAIEAAIKYADAMKKMDTTMQSLKNAAITPLLTALTPYIDELVEWVNTNRVLIKTDIKNFVTGLTGAIQVILPILRTTLHLIDEFGPAILAAVVAFNILKYGMLAVAAASKIFALVNTIIFAFQAVMSGACTAQEALNLVMEANPVGMVITVIAILIGLVVLLASKVGGLGNAFMVIGQTMMKWFLTPINYAIDAIKTLIGFMSNIPGMAGLKNVAADIDKFQAKANTMLTGSASHGLTSLAEPYKNALNAEQARKVHMADTSMLGRDDDMRTAPNQAQIDRQESHFSGRLEIAGAPAGSKVTQSSSGPVALRTELMGANP